MAEESRTLEERVTALEEQLHKQDCAVIGAVQAVSLIVGQLAANGFDAAACAATLREHGQPATDPEDVEAEAAAVAAGAGNAGFRWALTTLADKLDGKGG